MSLCNSSIHVSMLHLQYIVKRDACRIRIVFVFLPVSGSGNLCIQRGTKLSDVFPLFYSNFVCDGRITFTLCVVKHIEADRVALPSGLCQNPIFPFALGLDAHIMLGDPLEHIVALADVHQFVPNADAVNAGMLILSGKPLSFQIGNHVFLITVFACKIGHENPPWF